MNHLTTDIARMAALVAISGLLVLGGTACSRQARAARMLSQAHEYYAAGDYDRAEIEYKNVLQRDPQNGIAMSRLGAIYQEQGRDLRAVAFLRRARELQSEDLENRFRLGLAFVASGRLQEAREEAIFVLSKRPDHGDAPILLADTTTADAAEIADTRERLNRLPRATERAAVLVAIGLTELRQGRVAEAEAMFKSAQKADPRSPESYTALGKLSWARNDLSAADSALRQAAELSPARSPKRLAYARFKLQTGDTAAARQLLQTMAKNTPDYVPAPIWLAELAAREKKYDEAQALLDKVIARDPQQVDALLLAARVRLAKGEAARAVSELESLLAMFPKSPEVAYQLGLAHAANGDMNKALGRLTQAIALAPSMYQAVMAAADIHMRRREYGAAIATLEKLVQEHPELAAARAMLADAHRGHGNLDEAASMYSALEAKFPRDPKAPFWRGTILLQQNRRDDARKALQRAWALAPGQLATLELLVELDLRDKWYPVARQRIDSELNKAPRAELYLLLAKVQKAAGDSVGAEGALLKAAELQPNSAVPHFTLAQLYVDTGKPEKALASLKLAEARDSRQAGVPLLMGLLYESAQNEVAAREAYEKCLALDPKNTLALNNLAYLYASKADQLEKAQELAQAARDLLPASPEAADTLGWILHRRGQYARALPLLEQAANRLSTNPDVQFHLGMAHYMMGHENEARRALSQALELNSNFSAASEAQECLSLLDRNAAMSGQPSTELEKMLEHRKGDPLVLSRLAGAYEREGALDKALAMHETILQANPGNIPAVLNLARLYSQKNDLKRALELAKTARKLAPSDANVAHTVGRVAFQSGEHVWSVSLLEEAARHKADNPDLLYDLAEALYSIGRVVAAEGSMRRALDLDGTSARASRARQVLELTALASDPGKAAAAKPLIERALADRPDDPAALMASGAIYEHDKQPDLAMKQYTRALQRYPDFSPAQRRLSILYSGNPAESQRTYDLASKARKAYPDDPELAKVLGVALLRQKNFSRANSMLQEGVRRRADDGELMYYLGKTQIELKRQADAKRTLERALEIGLSDALAEDARQELAKLP